MLTPVHRRKSQQWTCERQNWTMEQWKKICREEHKKKHPDASVNFSEFFEKCSERWKSENPGLSIGNIAKKLVEMWNNTSAEDKQPYEEKAARMKEKYDKASLPDIVAYHGKGKPVPATATKAKKKDEEEDKEEDDDE
ncbi:hypothetical protein Z043_123642 [Scleropages formosus]|uniref:HMG box domain-containing protein n=1 Tax=Scleropages formosus TaxID=113540 RepID=A0A0P7TLF6_SCLFO|nr:hypothetical protein Z043_123642 [Scleropages formosus]